MKQCELPYERFDYEQAEKKLGRIIEGITAAKSAKQEPQNPNNKTPCGVRKEKCAIRAVGCGIFCGNPLFGSPYGNAKRRKSK